MDQATAIAPDETIVTIPWDLLHDSPLQYRKTYSQAAIDEIEATIRDTGRIHQPLVVRHRFPNPLFCDQYDPQDGYEIVFGHTRKRGGMAAGLPGGPCVIRDLNDAQVRAAQAAENIARSDVHALEEAEGFQAMIAEDGITADELATQLGKSKSYVYARLKLLALCPQVRQAVLASDIGTEVGLLIARVGGWKLQAKALGYIKGKYWDLEDGGKKSFRQIRDLLNERFTLDLKSAIFDIDDEMLVPSAGYCGRCPKRSGNAPEFEDILEAKSNRHGYVGIRHTGAYICTDPDCFDAKKKAHLAREAKKLEDQGEAVITGNKARAALGANGQVKGAFVELAKVRDLVKQATKNAKGSQAAAPQVVLIQDQRTGKTVKAVRREDLQSAGVQPPPEPPTRTAYGDTPEQRAQREVERKERESQLQAENQRRRALLDQVRAATRATERSAFDLQLVARAAFAGVDWNDRELLAELWGIDDADDDHDPREDHPILAKTRTLDARDLTQFILDCALIAGVHCAHLHYADEQPEALMAAARHYGIAADAADPAPTPSTAAQAKREAAAGKPAKKKRGAMRLGDSGAPNEPELPLEDRTDDAGFAGQEQMDNAGSAGGSAGQVDAFEEQGAPA